MAEPETPTAQQAQVRQAWAAGYGEGMADTIKRYNIRVYDDGHPMETVRLVLGVAILAATVGYIIWVSASQPHTAEASHG
jgi:hypothetical protein